MGKIAATVGRILWDGCDGFVPVRVEGNSLSRRTKENEEPLAALRPRATPSASRQLPREGAGYGVDPCSR